MELPVNYHGLHWTKIREIREEYTRLQNGLCCHCGEPLSGEPAKEIAETRVNKRLFPENFFKWPVHLHHNHDNGLTIGAVHCKCNAVLWEHYGE